MNRPRNNVPPSVGRRDNRLGADNWRNSNYGFTRSVPEKAVQKLLTPDLSPERGSFPHQQTDPYSSTHANAAWRGLKTAKELDLPWLKEERPASVGACYKSVGGIPVGSAWCRVNRKLLEKLLTRLHILSCLSPVNRP